MFRKIFLQISSDDHHNLHRVPFFLWWVGSYAIAWMLIYTYENPFIREMWDFKCWIRELWQYKSMSSEDLFVGLIFGLALSGVSGWLLKARYGHIPRGWYVGTIIGAILTGFGYPRIGGGAGPMLNPPFADKFLHWFVVLNTFQAIIMWRASKHGWWLFAVGSLAAGMSIYILHLEPVMYFPYLRIALLIGTLIQACGTAFAMMYIMADTVTQTTNKSKNEHKIKEGKRTKPFRTRLGYFMLWVSTFLMSTGIASAIEEMYIRILLLFPTINHAIEYPMSAYIEFVVWLIPFVILLWISQKWLLKRIRQNRGVYM